MRKDWHYPTYISLAPDAAEALDEVAGRLDLNRSKAVEAALEVYLQNPRTLPADGRKPGYRMDTSRGRFRTEVHLPHELVARVDDLAEDLGASRAGIMRAAVLDWLKDHGVEIEVV